MYVSLFVFFSLSINSIWTQSTGIKMLLIKFYLWEPCPSALTSSIKKVEKVKVVLSYPFSKMDSLLPTFHTPFFLQILDFRLLKAVTSYYCFKFVWMMSFSNLISFPLFNSPFSRTILTLKIPLNYKRKKKKTMESLLHKNKLYRIKVF